MYRYESWPIKKAEQWKMDAFKWMLEKTLESPLDCKDMKPIIYKGNKPWLFIGRTDSEAETPILWPPDVKSWLIGKDPDAGKDWRQKEKGMADDEIVRYITDSMDMNVSKLWEIMKDGEGWCVAVHGVTNSWTRLREWTTKTKWTN